MGTGAYTEAVLSFLREMDVGKARARVLYRGAGRGGISSFRYGSRFLQRLRFLIWFMGFLYGSRASLRLTVSFWFPCGFCFLPFPVFFMWFRYLWYAIRPQVGGQQEQEVGSREVLP